MEASASEASLKLGGNTYWSIFTGVRVERMLSSAADDPSLADLRPGHYVNCLPGRWMGPMEFYQAVRRYAATASRIKLFGTENAERAMAASSVDSDRAIALQFFEIRIGADQYRLLYHFESQHHYGEGGRAIHSAWLERNGSPVLKSFAVIIYDTYHDDSEDHEVSRSEAIYLLEDGELEAAVFASLK